MKPGLSNRTTLLTARRLLHQVTTSLVSRRSVAAALVLGAVLTGCGFKLRGSQSFAFSSIAITPYPGGALAQELRRSFGSAVRVLGADVPLAQAQVVLELRGEQREKVVVGVNASGQVRELQLRLRTQFRLTTPQGKELVAQDEILQQRDFSYSESAALAKETEEAVLVRDMQTDIAQQILRRLAALRSIE